ncbi:hypothetical protein [Candidatus Halocynthiibacter alkanivorans]|uniref:hypothetical protein n=1 Tax=Candidatus Halocynthiibacter alkanivorans TaxID=2267619 RepID=UPI000DF45E23|nr:hypothetical protein [Candidatus Halocynthiibacter alkanivorans]
MKMFRIAILPGALAVMAGSLVIGRAEYIAYQADAAPLDQQMLEFRRGKPGSIPYAISSQVRLMNRCYAGQTSLGARMYPEPGREALALSCLLLAQKILAASPSMSVAHLAAAVSYSRLGDQDGFDRALILARQTAAFEGWLASRRMDISIGAFDQLSDAAKEGFERDVTVLLGEWSTRKVVADRFVRFPAVQDAVLQAAGQQPSQVQNKFLNEVRKRRQAQDLSQ